MLTTAGRITVLDQGLAITFCKGLSRMYFRSCGPSGSVLLLQQESNHRQPQEACSLQLLGMRVPPGPWVQCTTPCSRWRCRARRQLRPARPRGFLPPESGKCSLSEPFSDDPMSSQPIAVERHRFRLCSIPFAATEAIVYLFCVSGTMCFVCCRSPGALNEAWHAVST